MIDLDFTSGLSITRRLNLERLLKLSETFISSSVKCRFGQINKDPSSLKEKIKKNKNKNKRMKERKLIS